MTLSRVTRGTLLALSVALGACAAEEEAAEAPPAPEPMSQGLGNAMRDAFVNSYMLKDAPGAAAVYADDAVMYSPDGTAATGKPAIEAAFTAMMAAGMDSLALVQTSWEAAGDMATDEGTFVMRTLDPQTKEATRENGNYMIVMTRQADGTFKITKDSTWVAAAPE